MQAVLDTTAPANRHDRPDALSPLFGSIDEIVDRAGLRAALTLSPAGPSEERRGTTAHRADAVGPLKDAYEAGRTRIADALSKDPMAARAAIHAYSQLMDVIVTEALHFAATVLHPSSSTKLKLAVLAVGGYGRAEMAPYSDVDVLFLTPYKTTSTCESLIESLLYILWDLKLKVGQSVRTPDECLRLAKSDLTIRTSLLEMRYLAGDAALVAELDRRLWDELFLRTGPAFVEAKLSERDTRHKGHGGSRYMLEPNVKEAKGGLRDLQTLFWIAKYLNNASTPDDLVALGVFTRDEIDVFHSAEQFLWATRCQLHLAAGRANEKLTFDMQVEVAAAFGFTDSGGRRAVEHFMQVYFRHAMKVGELTRIFIAALEARHITTSQRLARSFKSAFRFAQEPDEGYELKHGRLDFQDPDAALKDPLNLLRIFDQALTKDLSIHPDALRRITQSLHLIDDDLRESAEANQLFLDLLLSPHNPERALRHMNELGILGAFMPEFGRIVAMMQFNIYHSYTVDEHTIQCISNLFQIEQDKLIEELPIASSILKRGINRRVIYVAMLLHDIGKGKPEDHSEVGARIAQKIAPRLGLKEDEVETVVWLVRHHLLMSDMAQKRDISDPRTVEDFARIVQSPARLKLLTVLTVCDIRGVGPGAWNNWKAMLLRQLYREALAFLTEGATSQSRPERITEAQNLLADTLRDSPHAWTEAAITAELDRHYPPYWLGLDTTTRAVFADMARGLVSDATVTRIDEEPTRDATRACFAMPDHPGIFSRMAGAVAMAGANIVDARTYTTKDGVALSSFWLQDKQGAPYENARLDRLRRAIDRTLSGEVVARDELKSRDRVKKRDSEFRVPTEITFDNDGSDIFTIIEVDTRDRPGLLHDLTRTLADLNLSISSAIVATFGAQVVDTFYVKDLFGLKIQSREKQNRVADRLTAAIRQGVQRARQ